MYFLFGELYKAIGNPNQYYQLDGVLNNLVNTFFIMMPFDTTITTFMTNKGYGSISNITDDIRREYLFEKFIEKRGDLLNNYDNLSNELKEKMDNLFRFQQIDPAANNFYEIALQKLSQTFYNDNYNVDKTLTIKTYTMRYEFEIKSGFMDPKPKEIIKKIQDDLRITLNKREKNLISDNTIAILKKIKEKSKNDTHKEQYEKLKNIILDLIEQINDGELNKINYFMEMDVLKTYKFPNFIFENLSPVEGFSGNIKNSEKLKKIKKNFNRLKKILNNTNLGTDTPLSNTDVKLLNLFAKNLYSINNKGKPMFTENGQMIEYFNAPGPSGEENSRSPDPSGLTLPHKHTKYGQIICEVDINEIDNEEWLKNNSDIINDYSFIPQENKDKIVDSIKFMQKSISQTNDYIRNLFSEYKDIKVSNNDINEVSSTYNENSNIIYIVLHI